MPNIKKSEADCIESAYEELVGSLFKQLFANLTGEPASGSDQQHVRAFNTGLTTLRRAKTLALGAIGSSSPSKSASMKRGTRTASR